MSNVTVSGNAEHASPKRALLNQGLDVEALAPSYRGEDAAACLLGYLFGCLPISVPIRLWSGKTLQAGAQAALNKPDFVLVFRNPRAVWQMVLRRDPLQIAEAYFYGDIDIEGDLFAALRIKDHLTALKIPMRARLRTILTALRLQAINRKHATDSAARLHGRAVHAHTREENRDAINFHYDVSNEFYELWLDDAMAYSCAYFERSDVSLDEAQQAKLELICRKLLLKPGERLLDIGCGWGALLIHAARRYGVRAHGITLSAQQLQVARQRIAAAGLGDRVTVELRDYRDLEGEAEYDKIASVGMFEHVGLKNLPIYFSTVYRLLKPAGLFLNHGITHEQLGRQENVSTTFINRYVFPDGQLDSISNIQAAMEGAHFEIADVEALRAHYALTLRSWVARLERRHTRALLYVSEAIYRVWRLYMAACALEFESGHIGVYQVLAAKRGVHSAILPLTRDHLVTPTEPRS